ncbi:MAG TPA: hypothetical protein VGL73_03780 [Caulobacteraceae bacterium]
MSNADSNGGRRVAGGCLLAAGAVIASVFGGATLFVGLVAVLNSTGDHASTALPYVLMVVGFTLVFAGIPAAIGVLMVVFGWRLVRRPRPIAPPENTFV